uniref:Uncharacterized protein n=1 Tax=Fagus sylvatica TaxID=28930 RepID=A0A2N9GXW5_FAGSY
MIVGKDGQICCRPTTDTFRKELDSLQNTFRKVVGPEELVIDVPLVLEPAQWPDCCIYRVPKKLREVNQEAYTPKLISIGPLHHGKYELCEMEMMKLRYLRGFCYRTGKCQKDLSSFIEENELKIRHCYAETFDISSEDFVKMVLLDSTFIIELFLRFAESDGLFRCTAACGECDSDTSGEDGCNAIGKYEQDRISSQPIMKKHILQDLILLENQLPFFILDELHTQFSKSEQNKCISFLKLARKYLVPPKEKTSIDKKKVKHFTDLMRYVYRPSKPEVPCFEARGETEGLFRNLMALEQCHYPYEAYICDYFVLLDNLINTREDVEFLVEKGIIVNALGSHKAVAVMVNKLGLEIDQEQKSCYAKLTEDVNRYYKKRWNRNLGALRTIYFRDIWRGTATLVGVIVLLVTILNFLKPFIFTKCKFFHCDITNN